MFRMPSHSVRELLYSFVWFLYFFPSEFPMATFCTSCIKRATRRERIGPCQWRMSSQARPATMDLPWQKGGHHKHVTVQSFLHDPRRSTGTFRDGSHAVGHYACSVGEWNFNGKEFPTFVGKSQRLIWIWWLIFLENLFNVELVVIVKKWNEKCLRKGELYNFTKPFIICFIIGFIARSIDLQKKSLNYKHSIFSKKAYLIPLSPKKPE